MSLQFILGKAGSGKSEYCRKHAIRAEEQGKRVIIIVPEQYSHQAERAILKEKGYLCDDFNVTSFARLARKLITDAGVSQEPLSDAGKAMLVLKAIKNCKSKMTYYRTVAENQGYIALFSDAISEFKKGQITPESLRVCAEKTQENLFSARLVDLSYVYEEYNKLLSGNLSDSDDNLTLMASLSIGNEYIKGANIIIDEFYRFTQNEIACIESFLIAGASVTISLCMPEHVSQNSVFQSVNSTKNTLEQLANRLDVPVLPPIVLENSVRYLSGELSHLEKTLSTSVSPYEEEPDHIRLYIAKNKYEEVLHLAAQIRKYVKDTRASYREIAVIAGNYQEYSDYIQTIFPMYDIPVFADTRQDFLSHPIVLHLFSVFDLLKSISTKHVVRYMKSGFADISQEDAFLLENYALSSAIEYGDWLNDTRFTRKAKHIFDESTEDSLDGAQILATKNQLFAPILSLKKKITESKTVANRILALITFFEETHLTEKIEDRIAQFRQNGQLRLADEFAEVYGILMETMQTMVQLLGDDSIGIAGIRAILEAGLSQKSIGVIPTVYDQVSFGDLNRSVIKNVRALFVIGANDGAFPSTPASGALLSDSEREFLLSQGISVAPDTKKRIADNEFSVYGAVTICKELLFVSFPLENDNGGGLRPATFVSKLKRIFPRLSATSDLGLDEQPPASIVASKQAAYTYVLTHIHDLEKNETAKALYDMLLEDDAYRQRMSRAMQYSEYKNTVGRLSPDTVSKLYGNNLYGSVSRFERYASCPFSFFIEYGLKAKERKVLKVEAPDIGSLLHEIIERFSAQMKQQGKSFRNITQEEQQSLTNAIVEDMFGAMFAKDIYRTGQLDALKKRLKSLVSKSVWAICRHVALGKFEPVGFEVAFDKDGELAPVTVPLPGGGEITMRGRIDRIDALSLDGNLYLKIIDYKSGSKAYSLEDIFNGTTLQLAVYMIAATESITNEKGEKAGFGGMFYFHLDDPVADGIPGEQLDETNALKSFKMSGLSSDNPEIIHAIDSDINRWSAVIPVYMKTDGTVSKSQSKTADIEQFEKLKRHIKNTLAKIGQEILSGNVDIYPVKNKKSLPCSYCKYLSVCGFDPNTHHCRRATNFKSDEEIWERF